MRSSEVLESSSLVTKRGTFTGPWLSARTLKQTNGGALFLDEIKVPPSVQVKLLRFLQEREFERVGGNETVHVDTRIVAATNRDLRERVRDGRFREDLFYRLNVVQLDVPPLRARRSDIPLLAHHFQRKFARENGRALQGFSDEALRLLVSYPWPGNVRELENSVERAVVMSTGEWIEPGDLPTAGVQQPGDDLSLLVPGITLAELERLAIMQTLDAAGGSTARAAEILGISRPQDQYRLKDEAPRRQRGRGWPGRAPALRRIRTMWSRRRRACGRTRDLPWAPVA